MSLPHWGRRRHGVVEPCGAIVEIAASVTLFKLEVDRLSAAGYCVTGASSYGQSALAEGFCHRLFLSKQER